MDKKILKELAERFGTPTYIFDTESFRARIQSAREIVGEGVRLCYSIKANPFLIPAAEAAGMSLEVCSPGELAVCEKLGADPEKIVYSGVNKMEEDVHRAVSDRVGVYTAESIHQFMLLRNEARRQQITVPVLLRLNGGSQFGMSREDLLYLVDHRAEYPQIRIEGVHYFIGTQRKRLKKQREELQMLHDLFDEVREQHGFVLRRLEYGPGLPVPYFEGEDFSDTLRPLKELAPDLQDAAEWAELTVEMGRFFASECGYYLTKIKDMKIVGKTGYAFVDGGINHVNYLGGMVGMKLPKIFQIEGQYRECPGVDICRSTEQAPEEWTLCGSLCTTNDILVREMPSGALHLGDILVFCNIGAYSVSEGIYMFLSRTMPRIVLYNSSSDIVLARDWFETAQLNTPRRL